jgi:hypothetical protein
VEELDHLEALGLAHVVGVGLEGEPEHGDRLVVEGTQGLGYALHEVGGALAVDLHHRAQELEIVGRTSPAVWMRSPRPWGSRSRRSPAPPGGRPRDARVEPMPFITWLTSAPPPRRYSAMALMKEILAARKALERT